MFSASRLKSSDRRLGRADAFCNFSLGDTCGGTSLEKFVEELEFFVQSIVFRLHVCAFKGASFNLFMSEHF